MRIIEVPDCESCPFMGMTDDAENYICKKRLLEEYVCYHNYRPSYTRYWKEIDINKTPDENDCPLKKMEEK